MKTCPTFPIGTRGVGEGYPCFVIAEIGSNHNGDLNLARRLIDAAAKAGADAVKFQTFRARDHYSRKAPGFTYLHEKDTFQLIESLELDRTWHAPLKAHAEGAGVVFLTSPCDRDAVAELRDLDTLAYKVASFDLPDLDLIRVMAETQKPVLLSTGMADWMEIQRAVDVCRRAGNSQIALLQCTSLYPAPPGLGNLRALATMRAAFGTVVGYSDHSEGEHIALAAVALGASIVEKHFTLDRSLPGPDHPFAIEPAELTQMVQRLREVEEALGDGTKTGPRAAEQEMFHKARRSLHAAVAIRKGETIQPEMLTVKRPGFGIPPFLRDQVLHRIARVDIDEDQWLTWDML